MARTVLKLEEASEITGIPVETFRWWRKTGRGGPRTYKIGRRVVIDRVDLEKWLAEQRERTEQRPVGVA